MKPFIFPLARRAPAAYRAATYALVLALVACAAPAPPSTTGVKDFEGVPMAVHVEVMPDTTFLVTLRETSIRAGADPMDNMRLYQRAVAKVVADRCGPVQVPELVSETSKQGVAGRDYVFKCGLARLDRSQPQTLMQQR